MSELRLDPESALLFAQQLAPLVAEIVSERLAERAEQGKGAPVLISLEELVAELPESKKPETWRRWLYTYVRREDERQAMGAMKLGGSWFFDREQIHEWLASRW